MSAPSVVIDFFDVATHPVLPLPFPVPERTLPTTPSALEHLGRSLDFAVDRLLEALAGASRFFGEGSAFVASLDAAGVADRTGEALHRMDDVLLAVRRVVDEVTAEGVPRELGGVLGKLDSALAEVDHLVSNLDGERGLVTSAQRASDAVGDAARGSRRVERQLDATLQEVRQTSATVRRVLDQIDRNPDMLVKGRAKGVP